MLVTIEQKGAFVVLSLGYGLVYVFNIEALLSTLIRAPTLTHSQNTRVRDRIRLSVFSFWKKKVSRKKLYIIYIQVYMIYFTTIIHAGAVDGTVTVNYTRQNIP